jgi:hypothetical protein
MWTDRRFRDGVDVSAASGAGICDGRAPARPGDQRRVRGDGTTNGSPHGGGGGGGGGYYGGGGGGNGRIGDGGGGGGSSFLSRFATHRSGPTVTSTSASVSLTNAAPTAAESARAIAYATQPQGTASAMKTLPVTNRGSAPLIVSGVVHREAGLRHGQVHHHRHRSRNPHPRVDRVRDRCQLADP